MAQLTDASSYIVDPDAAWQRLKLRTSSGRTLAIAKELAAFRERYAQQKNIPRSLADLSKSRLLLRDARKGEIAEGLVAAVVAGLDMPAERQPEMPEGRDRSNLNSALADLLRVLLKAKAEEAGVATKLIASSADLDDIACGDHNGIWATGWRREVFGNDALRLVRGEIALSAKGDRVKIVSV